MRRPLTIDRTISVAELAAGSAGLTYLTGYLIHSLFVRNYGMVGSELLRLDYVLIGLTFLFLCGSLVVLPAFSFYLTYRVRRASSLPHFWLGFVGNALNAVVLLELLVLSTVFLTQYEWELSVPAGVWGIRTAGGMVTAGMLVAFAAITGVPVLERLVVRYVRAPRHARYFCLLIEPLRLSGLGASLYLAGNAGRAFGWQPAALRSAWTYIAVVVVGGGAAIVAWLWNRHIRRIPGSRTVLALAGIGVAVVYYLAVNAYVYGVYRVVPMNRGGRLPLTRAFLTIDDPSEQETERAKGTLTGPVFIIDETDDAVYYTSEGMERWFTEFIVVHAVKKDRVLERRLERIEDGFPRVGVPGGA